MGRKHQDAAFNPALREVAQRLARERIAEAKATGERAAGEEIDRRRAARETSRQRHDDELFAEAMAGVEKLPDKKRRAPPPAPRDAPRTVHDPDAEALAELAELVAGQGAFDIHDTGESIEGATPGVGPEILRRLRRGDFAIQAHLDLHGLSAEEARLRVDSFLAEARLRSLRCVLVVHGRGLHSKDQIPVLKERLRVWLVRGRLARMVLAFTTARPVDGGAGAVYVLLRR